jgi:two-component system OmpR family response regulator
MTEILLVEDDPVLGRALQISLEIEGYRVTWVRDLKSAVLVTERTKLNLILLDLNLPDGSGIILLKRLRDSGSAIPVIILTAKTDEDSVVEVLETGGNDYIRKPFGKRELSARVKTALRELQTRDRQVRFGDLTVFPDQRRVLFNETEVELKRREYDVLIYFIQHAESVVSRDDLINSLGTENEIYERTVDSHVSHVRRCLKKAGVTRVQITSIYGLGYRLEKK